MFRIFGGWRSRNPDVRSRAIKRCKNLRKLKHAALHDPDSGCRRDAVDRIKDDRILAEVLVESNFENARELAASMIGNQEILAAVAVESSGHSDLARASAAWRLKDKAILAQLARFDPSELVRGNAISASRDQALRAEAAQRDVAPKVRLRAIGGLGVEMAAILVEIAESEVNSDVRFGAVERLGSYEFASEQPALGRIAINERDPKIRKEAVYRLTDQTLLMKIATEDSDPEIRAAARRRVPDKSAWLSAESKAGIAAMSGADMVRQLERLCQAYAANDRSLIEECEPVGWTIGQLLYERGGIGEMRSMAARIPPQTGKGTLEMLWSGIGSWEG